MKAVLVFVCVLAAALAHGLPPSERAFLKQVHDACQANPKTYCDESKLRNLVNNVNDHQVGVHMSCMAIKAGLQRPDGEFNIPVIKNKLSLVVPDPGRVNGYINQCVRKVENPGKSANLMWICFVQNGVEYYHRL